MRNHEFDSGPGLHHSEGTRDLVTLLRRASWRAEALLQTAKASGGGDLVLRLDEASQDVHRALVALES